jgi:hypothetical protein
MNWKLWLHGLVAAAVGGTTTTAAAYLGNWAQATLSAASAGQAAPALNGGTVGALALGGAIIGAVGYLLKSPVQQQTNTTQAK